ncbi:MAG: hypothetical protein EOP00_13705 [Pedobacter sp.]|nr:MAG: hypothetical protein EOP00_13705 [Pedobacter sp.]
MKNFLLFSLLVLSANCFSQKIYADKHFGFSINHPKNWIINDNTAFIDSLLTAKTESDTSEIIDENNGVLLLAKFEKFAKNTTGFNPVVEINLLNNQTLSFDDFFEDIKASSQLLKSLYQNFAFVNEAKIIDINDYKAITFDGKFNLIGTKNVVIEVNRLRAKTQKNYEIPLKTKFYAIPLGKYFIQISYTTEADKKDDELVLSDFIKSLKIGT